MDGSCFAATRMSAPPKTASGVITSAPVLGDTALEVLSGPDVVAPTTTNNVNPGHISDGSAGTRTRNQRLKRATFYNVNDPALLFYCYKFGFKSTGDGLGICISARCIRNVCAARSSSVDMRITGLASPSMNRAVATSTVTYWLRSADEV